MDSLNCSFDYGELNSQKPNSQKEAIITYVQKENVLKSNYHENKLSEFLNESLNHYLPEYLIVVSAIVQTEEQ